MAKKNADRNQEIYAPRSIWKHSQTIAREERYEGGKRLRIPLNSKKKPKPSRSSQTCPNCNGIQEKKEMKKKKHKYTSYEEKTERFRDVGYLDHSSLKCKTDTSALARTQENKFPKRKSNWAYGHDLPKLCQP